MELIIFSVKVIHVIVSVLLIIVVLLQPGKSGDLGSIFGGGTSESIFGSSGAVPFLTKLTRGLAVLFMLTSLSLGYFAASSVSKSVVKDVDAAPVEESAPVQNPDAAETGDAATAPESAPDAATAPETPADSAMESTGDAEKPAGEGAPASAPEGDAGNTQSGETN